MLRLASVTVRRGPNLIVEGLDLEVRTGGIFWVVGPNGAGKSSLLRVMALLDEPAAGRVERRTPAGSPFLYFQSEMVLPRWSTVGDWDRLVDSLLPEAEAHTVLWPDASGPRTIGRLSTGERKRLLLDALLRRPGSLLLDEPYEHLSPDGKAELTRMLEARARDHVVVVASNQEAERARLDGGLRLEAGLFERLGPAREVSRS